jgi:hypothetical protein
MYGGCCTGRVFCPCQGLTLYELVLLLRSEVHVVMKAGTDLFVAVLFLDAYHWMPNLSTRDGEQY